MVRSRLRLTIYMGAANACTGALFQCTNVPQTAFEFSRIFAGFRG